MKRWFQPGQTLIPFGASLGATIVCLLFALTVLVVAKIPARQLSVNGSTKGARANSTGSTMSQDPQVTSVPPFVGTNSETWEGFGVGDIPTGTSILGGIATIAGDFMVTAKTFQLCSVFAKPSDGRILMDADRGTGPTTISFSQPVSAFGAYWGTGYRCARFGFDDAEIILTFYDASNNVIGSDRFAYQGNGTLAWHGYNFSRPVMTVTRVASDGTEGFAVDGLQATVAPPGGGNSALLANISTRAFVETGDNAVIGGLVITGSGQKKVILRAMGPSLANGGVTNPLQNPTLELHDATGAVIASNDDWMNAPNKQEIIDSGLAPGNNLESAILTSLNPGNYTAIVRGGSGGTGLALVEAYDLDLAASSKLGNISTRALVQIGDNVMIAGLIISGTGQRNLIVRALGPSLTQQGITNPLLDPTVELHDGNGAVITFDDNWTDSQQTEIQNTGLAPGDDRESAILSTLSPGNYTAIVRGNNNTIGVAVVEVYGLN